MVAKALVSRDRTFELCDVSTVAYQVRIVTFACVTLRSKSYNARSLYGIAGAQAPLSQQPETPSGRVRVAELTHLT